MGKKVNECLLKISSWLSYALNQYGCHNIHSQQEYRRKTNEYGGGEGNQQEKPLEIIPFFCRKSKHQLLLRGSSAANQGENTLQCFAIAGTLHGIHLNKCRFLHLSEASFLVPAEKQAFISWNLSHFELNVNHAIKMPISTVLLSPRVKGDQVSCRCPCCTFWPLGDKNAALTTSAAAYNSLSPRWASSYTSLGSCAQNPLCDDQPELGTVAVPACIVR